MVRVRDPPVYVDFVPGLDFSIIPKTKVNLGVAHDEEEGLAYEWGDAYYVVALHTKTGGIAKCGKDAKIKYDVIDLTDDDEENLLYSASSSKAWSDKYYYFKVGTRLHQTRDCIPIHSFLQQLT